MLVFAEVVHSKSFTRAARTLRVTKQSISDRVRRLEEQLGVKLLERTTRRLRLTDIGAEYYERCKAIASQIDEANRQARDRHANPAGLLRVSAPYLFGRTLLAPLLTELAKQHASLRVELVLNDRKVDLLEEGFDVAIRIGPLEDSSFAARRLGEAQTQLMASPQFLARHRFKRAADFRSEHCVGTRAVETWRFRGAPLRVEPGLVMNDLQLVADAVASGLGIAMLPSLATQPLVERGALRAVSPKDAIATQVHALFPSRRLLSANVRVLLDALGNDKTLKAVLAARSAAGSV